MNEITREMTGLDFDWLAIDRNGRIALLTTAGSYFGDPYRRIAVPARPLHITELPDDIASLLRADASLASESFAEMSSLATPTD